MENKTGCSANLTKRTNESNIQVIAPAKVKTSVSSNRRVGHLNNPQKNYQKPFKTIDEQIALLKERGLIVVDEDFAKRVLSEINYYRLEGYWFSFYDTTKPSHTFFNGTEFKTIYRHYCFDQKLRTSVFHAISSIEIALKTQFAYELGRVYGPFPFVKENFRFKFESDWIESYNKLLKDMKNNSKELFVKHHLETYKEKLLPIWGMVEIMSFGEISTWFDKQLSDNIKKKISNRFSVQMNVFTSWIRCISLVRNICAHHARLWNKILPIKIMIPSKMIKNQYQDLFMLADEYQSEKRIYNVLLTIQYLLDEIQCDMAKGEFLLHVKKLIDEYDIDEKRMGIDNGRSLNMAIQKIKNC